MDNAMDITDLVERLGSDEDSIRKMAVFKLQSLLSDPSFADVFIIEGGLPKLTDLTIRATGNTLAYSLTSFSRLLELDKGWEFVSEELIERAVQLVVTQPLVNILRSAVSVLVAIVSHPQTRSADPNSSGFHALKPAVSVYPQFLEMLVNMLSSAEHLLCANALQLINSLVRDAVVNDPESEWPKFIRHLQELGVIKAVYFLMQGQALQDLAQPLLEFQSLTKIMLRKWKHVAIDFEKSDHKRALRSISVASYNSDQYNTKNGRPGSKRSKDPERWRRLGFDTEFPGPEFNDTGFLGMMDLTDFVVKNEDQFGKLILEQMNKSTELRCPISKASLVVTHILYEHFEVDKDEAEDAKNYAMLEARGHMEKAFKPLLLHWSRLHTAGLNAFLRLWKTTAAEAGDFGKIFELVRILIEQVVGQASRTKDIVDAENELADIDLKKLRDLQMELVELSYEDAWGHHLRQVRDDLNQEAFEFVKEQRIRCLLEGAWFPAVPSVDFATTKHIARSTAKWRYVRLSYNRRYLQWVDIEEKTVPPPSVDDLTEKLDLAVVSSVVSNVTASPPTSSSGHSDMTSKGGPVTAIKNDGKPQKPASKITIHGVLPGQNVESILLTLHPQNHTFASEWLDGLLMLLNQKPITAETNNLVGTIGSYGLKIRLLNIRYEDINLGEKSSPDREGLDEDYYYDFGEAVA